LLATIDRPKYGTAEKVPGKGRPHTAHTADNATVEELVRSQKDKPQRHHMVRETARDIGIYRSSVGRINRKDLVCRQCRVCRYSNNDSLKCARNYCVDGSICHFKFPKVVQHVFQVKWVLYAQVVKCLFQDMPINFYWVSGHI